LIAGFFNFFFLKKKKLFLGILILICINGIFVIGEHCYFLVV
jgi:hypothetical protein